MLYPRESERRELKDLSGIWRFKLDPRSRGREDRWFSAALEDAILMPVPSSYNDVTQSAEIRDYIGAVWYERSFFVPQSWRDRRVFVHVGSAAHRAVVWINGREAGSHVGGFLPFSMEVDGLLEGENRITVAVDNTLSWNDLPAGEVIEKKGGHYPPGFRIQETHFDFFNYAGLHRPVILCALPSSFVEDVTVATDIEGEDGIVSYSISVDGPATDIRVRIVDREGEVQAGSVGAEGRLPVRNAAFWRPGAPYLYQLEMRVFENDGSLLDCYRLPVGIRTVRVEGGRFLINGEPFYFRGFGKHEDGDIRGRGLDRVTLVKDINLMKWIGANSFRTSHYPYAEETLDLADREGIVVIDEVAAVGFIDWNAGEPVFCEKRINGKTLEHHLRCLRELYRRDKNHPSVVMWNLSNEPSTAEEAALPYFQEVVRTARELDRTRPITLTNCTESTECRVAQLFDVVSVNRYYGWYVDCGRLDLIEDRLERDLRIWHERFGKPVLLSEYGADTVAGLHSDPPVMFSEEFQREFFRHYHNVLDRLDFLIGEHVWVFADFATKQEVRRAGGNRKGIFTRQRQPKSAAFLLKERWTGER